MPKVGLIASMDTELMKEIRRLRKMLLDNQICLTCGTQKWLQMRDGYFCPQCEPEKNPRTILKEFSE